MEPASKFEGLQISPDIANNGDRGYDDIHNQSNQQGFDDTSEKGSIFESRRDEIDGGGIDGEDSLCDDNVEGDILPEDLQISQPGHERPQEQPTHSQRQETSKNQGGGDQDSDALSIDDFHILNTLGTGTFGRVRLVKFKHSTESIPLALKMLKKTEIIRLKQIEHVKSEKRILERIEHPFIIKLYGTFQNNCYIYMLLDYACGGEVFSLLRREGRFANDVALFYAVEIILAFEYLHNMDITYRDLKPENLLICHEGHIKITDFGFAKVVKDKTYTLCGTPEYLAPEIIQSKGHEKSVDWWALGVLIFEMLAGYPPFYDDKPMGIYQRILDGYYEIPQNIDKRSRDLIKRLLVAEKGSRLACGRNGPSDLKAHSWFRGVDWKVVYRREIPPPWVPQLKNSFDTQYFERYPDSQGAAKPPPQEEQRHFIDF